MALVINDTTYAGTFASYFWLPATFGMDTIQKGAVYVKDGIKKKHTIGRIDLTNPLQPRQATPVSNAQNGQFVIDGRSLQPQDHMFYTEFNPRDFEEHWLAEQLSPTLLARELPVTAENYMMQIALNRTMEIIETEFWMGSTTYNAIPGDSGNGQLMFMDGFLKKMVNDSAVVQIANPVALTSANILGVLDSLISSVAANKKALISKPTRYERMKFFVSINTEQIYQAALTTGVTFKGLNTMDRGIKPWKGYEIVPLAGFPDNTVLFCEGLTDTSSNLYVGMNSTEDNNLQLMRLQNNSELFFLKGLMKFDVQYGFSDQVFLYTTLNAAYFNS
ncbi:MAG: hypothetical protein WCH59_09300 [Chitinophagia bacterium]|jgi:hypothetical protein